MKRPKINSNTTKDEMRKIIDELVDAIDNSEAFDEDVVCPFCGETMEVYYKHYKDYNRVYHYCIWCGWNSPVKESEKESANLISRIRIYK